MAKSVQQKVIDKKNNLDNDINNLSNYRCTDEYLTLSDHVKNLLTKELDIMMQYSKILQERIDDFNK